MGTNGEGSGPEGSNSGSAADRAVVRAAHGTFLDDVDATVIKSTAHRELPIASPAKRIAQGHSVDEGRTVVDPNWPKTARPNSHIATQAQAEDPPLPLKGFATTELPMGFRLYEYRIDRLLGKGGFGLTYLATDVNLNARVAIKEYLPEQFAFRKSTKTVSASSTSHIDRYQQGLDNFLIEARTLASFRHPNIVRVVRFFEANQTAYIVQEYEEGDALRSWWPSHRDLPEQDLVQLLQPLLDGMSVVHATGFLHRDIKPDNIYVRRENGSLVLLDFGSAKQAVGGTDSAEQVLTPGYAPIEQYDEGGQGAWTDIYGLGATLYWMVTGKKPPAAPERVIGQDPMVSATEAGLGRFSNPFLAAIDWALKPIAADRPKSIAQFSKALFAAHASSLGIQEALRAGDSDSPAVAMPWLAVLVSPHHWKTHIARWWRDVVEPSSWPLSIKMTVAMVVAAMAPMLATGYYNLYASLETVSGSELRNLEQLALSTAGRLAQLIGDSKKLARALGSDADFVNLLTYPSDMNKESIRVKLESLVQSNPDIHLLMVMDTGGTAIVSSDPEVMGKNFKFRAYFKGAIEGKPFTTGIVVGAVAGMAGMFYSYPVFDEGKTVIGAVVMRIKASSFATILEEVRANSRRTSFLIDGDGVVIYHPQNSTLYSSLTALPPDKLLAIRADQRFRRDQVASLNMPDLASVMVGAKATGNISYSSTISRTPEIAGYAPVQGHDWVVGVTESREDFERPLNALFFNLHVSLLLVGMLFLGVALRFARSIARPVEELTAAAHALKSGDYSKASITVRTRDEIGQLARTFNVLIDVLRQRERERNRSAKSDINNSRKTLL